MSDSDRSLGARLSSLDWWLILFSGAGLLIGGWLGARYGFESGDPTTSEWFSPEFGTVLTTVGILAGLGVFGLVLSIPESTRPLGVGMLITGVFVLVGFPIGAMLGPKWQPSQSSGGHVRLELTGPVAQVLEAGATCETLPNDGRVGTIEAAPLGRVGIDDLRLTLSWLAGGPTATTSATIRLRVNTSTGYEGSVQVTEASPDRRTGRATFSGLDSRNGWIGGNHGALSGSISWDCRSGSSSGNTPTPSPVREDRYLQGWFHLHGLVTVDDVPGATPPFEGQASGVCSPAYELRTDAIETVVTWVNGTRARLRLVPEPTRATLTVTPGDGSPSETVSAPATVRFLNAAHTDRELSATFNLAAGTLDLTVDWWCKN